MSEPEYIRSGDRILAQSNSVCAITSDECVLERLDNFIVKFEKVKIRNFNRVLAFLPSCYFSIIIIVKILAKRRIDKIIHNLSLWQINENLGNFGFITLKFSVNIGIFIRPLSGIPRNSMSDLFFDKSSEFF